MKKILKNNILGFILGAVIFGSISVVFAYSYFATSIDFDPENDAWDVKNVDEALNDLYSKNSSYSTIKFNTDGGTTLATSIKIKKGEKLWSLPTASKQGCAFAGWYSDNTYTTKITEQNLDTNSNKTLYAKWIYGKLISEIPKSEYNNYIGQTVNYNGDSNWSILYIGDDLSSDGVHMYLISKTARWTGKPTANGTYSNSVLYKPSGNKLSAWSAQYSASNGNSNGASKTWSMLTPENYTTYCDSTVCEYAAGGPTIDLFYKAYNLKTGSSININNFNSVGYAYDGFRYANNPFNLSNSSFWFASPGSYGNGWVMVLSGTSSWCLADKDGDVNFNPIVSIKTTGVIYNNGTDYSITTI